MLSTYIKLVNSVGDDDYITYDIAGGSDMPSY